MPIWIFILLIFAISMRGNTSVSNQYAVVLTDFLDSYHLIPYTVFILVSTVVSFYAIRLKWSLIPVLGLLTNLYLMSELGITNWMRFGIWLVIGLALYFSYGSRKSRLNHPDFDEAKILE